MTTLVSCYSLRDFRALQREQDVAVVSIRDDGQAQLDLTGWGPSLVCLFTDVEYDVGYVLRWGWKWTAEAGLFTPTEARRVLAFLKRPDVAACRELVVHCHAGRSRSVAVGEYAAELLCTSLRITQEHPEPNKTVAQLLRDPEAMGDDRAADTMTAEVTWREMLGKWKAAIFG